MLNPINRISGFVCFFFLGALPPQPLLADRLARPPQGALPLDPAKGVAPRPQGNHLLKNVGVYFEFKF